MGLLDHLLHLRQKILFFVLFSYFLRQIGDVDENGLLLLSGGQCSVRVAPPLVITKEKFDEGLDILEKVLRKI